MQMYIHIYMIHITYVYFDVSYLQLYIKLHEFCVVLHLSPENKKNNNQHDGEPGRVFCTKQNLSWIAAHKN